MTIQMNLESKSYSILIEEHGLNQVGSWVNQLWKQQAICLITDETVNALYGELVYEQLVAAGFSVTKYVITPGEQSKSLAQAEQVYDVLTENQFTRSDGIIALGGGVVGDLAGFVAATFMRGIHYLQIPTTLLAQVDSSIGGKTAVNTNKAKNIVGAFWQPDGVLIDTDTLNTLSKRRVSEGTAEIIKYAAIADKKLWEKLLSLNNLDELIDDAKVIITACLRIKKQAVEEDPFDNGRRLILNFGHTIGHAIEKTSGYGNITHGEAVSIGMIQINQVAEAKGISPKGSTQALRELAQKFDLPTATDTWNQPALYEALTHDKKARGNKIKLVLLTEIGTANVYPVTIDSMNEFLERAE
ncbi:MAG: 3-dehydroquinate synthase [Enterococcus sp.]